MTQQNPQAAFEAEVQSRIALTIGREVMGRITAETAAEFREIQVQELQEQTRERTEEIQALRDALPAAKAGRRKVGAA